MRAIASFKEKQYFVELNYWPVKRHNKLQKKSNFQFSEQNISIYVSRKNLS